MRPTIVIRYAGLVLMSIAGLMLVSGIVDLFFTGRSATTLLISAVLVASFGAFPMVFVPSVQGLMPRESLAVVSLGWLAAGVVGALPYILWGDPFTVVNAIFESFSGLTTTGSSILIDVEIVPAGLLFWRASTHWLGGVGIIVLAVAVLPTLHNVSRSLFQGEYSPVAATAHVARTSEIARIVAYVYLGLTVLETAALMLTGLPWFDAVTTSFATIATGGFSVRNGSIAAYGNVTAELVILLFMILSGLNFSLLFVFVTTGKVPRSGRTTALTYLGIFAGMTLVVSISLRIAGLFDGVWEVLRYASFQVASITTSTGFATTDTNPWPDIARSLLVLGALVGASAGSTSGAIKVDRIVLLAKLLNQRFKHLAHPEAVHVIRIDGGKINEQHAWYAMLFIVAYFTVIAISTLSLTALGTPMLEAFTGTIACIGNIGPGLGEVGSMGNYASIPDIGKLILAAVMLVGRLEIYGVLMILTARFWEGSRHRQPWSGDRSILAR